MTKIPTRRTLVQRAIDATDEALERHKWLPLAVAVALLVLFNSPF